MLAWPNDPVEFRAAVARWSPDLVDIALAFTGELASARTLVSQAWLDVARQPPCANLRNAVRQAVLVRALAQVDRESWERGLAVTGPVVAPERFRPLDAPRYPRGWLVPPVAWPDDADLGPAVGQALAGLPAPQRVVVALRDQQGFSAEDVCEILDLTVSQQRAMLHRGRAALRGAIEEFLAQPSSVATASC